MRVIQRPTSCTSSHATRDLDNEIDGPNNSSDHSRRDPISAFETGVEHASTSQ